MWLVGTKSPIKSGRTLSTKYIIYRNPLVTEFETYLGRTSPVGGPVLPPPW